MKIIDPGPTEGDVSLESKHRGTRMRVWQKVQSRCEVRNIITNRFVRHFLFIHLSGGASDEIQLPRRKAE